MQKIILNRTGEEMEVDNNVAHAFIDRGLAKLKGMDKPPKDKTFSLKRSKVRKKNVSDIK
jgi:hypothetical protein